MTTDSRFLALVAKVGEEIKEHGYIADSEPNSDFHLTQSDIDRAKFLRGCLRALKGEIMRHEPRPTGYRYSDNEPTGYECSWCYVAFPCKPFLDMERKVGK